MKKIYCFVFLQEGLARGSEKRLGSFVTERGQKLFLSSQCLPCISTSCRRHGVQNFMSPDDAGKLFQAFGVDRVHQRSVKASLGMCRRSIFHKINTIGHVSVFAVRDAEVTCHPHRRRHAVVCSQSDNVQLPYRTLAQDGLEGRANEGRINGLSNHNLRRLRWRRIVLEGKARRCLVQRRCRALRFVVDVYDQWLFAGGVLGSTESFQDFGDVFFQVWVRPSKDEINTSMPHNQGGTNLTVAPSMRTHRNPFAGR